MPTDQNPVRLNDSFSYLLRRVRRGEFQGDTPRDIYYFGCARDKEAIASTVRNYDFPVELLPGVLAMLAGAEAEGRVSWKIEARYGSLVEQDRFRVMLDKARSMGAMIPDWDECLEHRDAYWNIPAMRRFLEDSVFYVNRI